MTQLLAHKEHQLINTDGRLQVPIKALILRVVAIITIVLMFSYNLFRGSEYHDPLIVYSTLMPIHACLVMGVGWFFFKAKKRGKLDNSLVSVIVPVFNQEKMISTVIKAIFSSTYPNFEVIIVNDGSNDNTKHVLDALSLLPKYYGRMTVIHNPNEGKRKAVATGFAASRGMYIVLIDSDSVIDKNAISQLIRTLTIDRRNGAVVGECKIWNANTSLITKFQDAWYDYAFNIHKTAESVFGAVLCCSGCLSAYRRVAIENFIPYWIKSKHNNSDDRDLTAGVLGLSALLKLAAKFDDAEDRILTGQSLSKWRTVYAPRAIVWTEAPSTFRGYIKQQIRWKKGYIRSNFYVSTFFWKKHPLMALIFYSEFMFTFTAPLIAFIILFYEPVVLKHYNITIIFVLGSMLIGLVQGLDYKARVPQAVNWKYKPLVNLLTSFLLCWLVFPAIYKLRKNEWLTR